MNVTRTQLFLVATVFVLSILGFFVSECRTQKIVRNEVQEIYNEQLDASLHGGGLGHVGSWAPNPGSGPIYSTNGVLSSGSGVFGPHTTGAEPIFEPVCVGPGTQKVWTSGPLANGEGYDLDINAQLVTDAGGVWSHCRREWHGTNVNGVFQWADGGLSDIPTLTDFGGALANASCQVTWDAGASGQLPTLSLMVTTDAGACVVPGLSNQRAIPPLWAPLSIDQAVPASMPPTVTSPTVVQFLGTHDILSATVSSIRIQGASNNVTLTSLGACNSGLSTNCVQGTWPSGSYTAETDTVTIVTAAGTFTFPYAVANANPSLTACYVTAAGPTAAYSAGPAEGGQGVTCTGTNMSTTTAISFGGTNGTSLSCGSSSCTVVTPAGSFGQANVVASPGSSTLTNGYYYYPTTEKITMLSDIGITTATGVSNWADQVTPGATFAYAQATGGAQPAQTPAFNGFPILATSGSSWMRNGSTFSVGTNQISQCAIFAVTASTSGFMLASSDTPSSTVNEWYLTPNGSTSSLSAFQNGVGGVGGGNTTGPVLTAYHHWCVTYDHTAGTGVVGVLFYVDGAVLPTCGTGNCVNNTNQNQGSANFAAGNFGLFTASGGAGAANGSFTMVEMQVYGKLLSSGEVASLHTAAKTARSAGGMGYTSLP